MSISATFRSAIIPAANISATSSFRTANGLTRTIPVTTGNGGLVIECSSRPQKKATAHHMKTRPRKTQPWDVRRKPTEYAPLPPLPPDWTLLSFADDAAAASATEAALAPRPPLQPPISSG